MSRHAYCPSDAGLGVRAKPRYVPTRKVDPHQLSCLHYWNPLAVRVKLPNCRTLNVKRKRFETSTPETPDCDIQILKKLVFKMMFLSISLNLNRIVEYVELIELARIRS